MELQGTYRIYSSNQQQQRLLFSDEQIYIRIAEGFLRQVFSPKTLDISGKLLIPLMT